MFSQDPGEQRNLLLAILLSVGVMLAWQVLYLGPKDAERRQRTAVERQDPANEQIQNSEGAAPTVGAAGIGSSGVAPSAGRAPVAATLTRDAALKLTQRLPIVTPSLSGSINLTGGRIDDLLLTKYRQEVDPDSPKVVLFSPASAPNTYFAEHGWTNAPGSTTTLPDRNTLWSTASGETQLTPEKPVTLVWNNGEGLVFKRTISVDENYLFEIVDAVENATSKPVNLAPYGRIYRLGIPEIEGFFIQHEGMIGFLGEDQRLTEITYSDAVTSFQEGKGNEFKKIKGGWLGFTDKYWASALLPSQTQDFTARMLAVSDKTPTTREAFQTDYIMPLVTVPASGSKAVTTHLFAGAKKVDLINQYEAKLGILEFNYLIDWGWFYFITKPLYQLINWFYGLLGNFGLAILAVTVVVKAAFFWFANKSYESMAKMKKLQPEMERLRERYKDDRMAQQKELMELYKKEKINPLAGCLPVLIQIPVFFALYKVLFVSIDMRHAPFFGWIQDLSAKDPTTIFNLFGFLPYQVPDFLIIGIWPLVMGVTMWLQMQLNPQQPDPTQQMIFNWMPVLFTILLASFPAGLVIYWAWNNVLSLAQQYLIMKRQGVDVPLFDNLKRNFSAVGKFLGGLTKPGKS
ncbi:MAG: membrane protein insertase YidC [Hyphomicrobiaceae bacterium]